MIDYFCFDSNLNDLSEYNTGNSRMIRDNTGRFYIYRVIKEASKLGKALLFNFKSQKFIDMKSQTISVRGLTIHLFSSLYSEDMVLNRIFEQGGYGTASVEGNNKVLHWFEHFPIERTILKLTFKELCDNIEQYMQEYGINNTLFIKTVKKKESGVYTLRYIEKLGKFLFFDKDNHCLNNHIENNTEILITKPLKIREDRYGRREWRTFVIQNEIQNMSRYFHEHTLPIDSYVREYIESQVKRARHILPSSYVIDTMEYIGGNERPALTVTEFNPINRSGLYYDNVDFPILNKTK